MNFPCPNVVECECTNFPIQNLSAEGPDAPTFIAWKNVYNPPKLKGQQSTNPYDYGWWWCHVYWASTISQKDAEKMARIQGLNCWPPGAVGNDEIEITVECP